MTLTVSSQFARFLVVGLTAFLLNAAIYSGLVTLGVHYLIASGVGWIVGIVNSFFLNKRFTFKSEGSVREELPKTIFVYVVQLVVSWTGLIILIDGLGFGEIVAFMINVVVVTAVSFIGLKFFAFQRKAPKP